MAKKKQEDNPVKDQEDEKSTVESVDSPDKALLKGAFVGRPDTRSMGARHGKLTGKESSATPGTWETREEMFERLNKLYNIEETEHNYVEPAGDFGKDNESRKNAPRFDSVPDPSKKKRSRPGPKARAKLRAKREAEAKDSGEKDEPAEDPEQEEEKVDPEVAPPAEETAPAVEEKSEEDEDPKAKKGKKTDE